MIATLLPVWQKSSIIKLVVLKQPDILPFPQLDRQTTLVRAYADAYFRSNVDSSFQIRFIVVLMGASNRFSIVQYTSAKCRRIVPSSMACECTPFGEAFDAPYVLKYELEKMFVQCVPLGMITDSRQWFEIELNATKTKEQCLLIDVVAAR